MQAQPGTEKNIDKTADVVPFPIKRNIYPNIFHVRMERSCSFANERLLNQLHAIIEKNIALIDPKAPK